MTRQAGMQLRLDARADLVVIASLDYASRHRSARGDAPGVGPLHRGCRFGRGRGAAGACQWRAAALRYLPRARLPAAPTTAVAARHRTAWTKKTKQRAAARARAPSRARRRVDGSIGVRCSRAFPSVGSITERHKHGTSGRLEGADGLVSLVEGIIQVGAQHPLFRHIILRLEVYDTVAAQARGVADVVVAMPLYQKVGAVTPLAVGAFRRKLPGCAWRDG